MSFELELTLQMVLGLVVIAVLFVGGIFTWSYLDYLFDESNCAVFVEGEKVYEGKSHFFYIDSVGENGSTKCLYIYKDIATLKKDRVYVSEDIKVSNIPEN